MLTIAPGTIGIGTARNFPEWDHVVEANLDVDSGRIVAPITFQTRCVSQSFQAAIVLGCHMAPSTRCLKTASAETIITECSFGPPHQPTFAFSSIDPGRQPKNSQDGRTGRLTKSSPRHNSKNKNSPLRFPAAGCFKAIIVMRRYPSFAGLAATYSSKS
jgi:hypothetical protein